MRNNRSAIWSNVIVINPGLRVNEIVIGSEVKKEGFVERGEYEAKRVIVSESVRVRGRDVSTMGGRWKRDRISGYDF